MSIPYEVASLASSSSSVTLFDRNNQTTSFFERNLKKMECSWGKVGKAVAIFILFGILVVLSYHLHIKITENALKTQERACFECTWSSDGLGIDEPGFPLEKRCRTEPHNSRKCLPGEVCQATRIVSGKFVRFVRSCGPSTVIGCTSRSRPTEAHTCTCNTNLCIHDA